MSVYGEVKREGIYELKESENLYDLLNIAGSLKDTAYMNRAQITRIIPPIDREKIDMERMIVDIDLRDNLNKNNTFKLVDGDILKIFSISKIFWDCISVLAIYHYPSSPSSFIVISLFIHPISFLTMNR